MVTPAVRREAVAHLQVTYRVSERRACSRWEQTARQCAIAAGAPPIWRYEPGCANLRPFADGSAIVGSTSCSGARAS